MPADRLFRSCLARRLTSLVQFTQNFSIVKLFVRGIIPVMETPHTHEELISAVLEGLRDVRAAGDRLDDALAARFSLNRSDLRCLALLYADGQLPAGQLAEGTGLSPGATTTAIDRLERAGYAMRVVDPHDRRRVVVSLTPAALELGARLYGEVELDARRRLESLPEDDLVIIRDYLLATHAALDELGERVHGSGAEADGPAADPREFVAPLGPFTQGRLEFQAGAGKVDVSVDPSLTDLCRARFTGIVPEVQTHEGTVTIRQKRRFRPFDWRTQETQVVLGTATPWEIAVRGGLWKFDADLTALELTSLEITGGASDIAIVLPAPAGTVPIRVTGGASKIMLRRPPGVAVQAVISGGASELVFDGQKLHGVGGQTRLESDGYREATDRYSLRFAGGASRLVIESSRR